ncbi:MAG: radical SAM/SPASM domain-containing protein [Alphaproteobacteria bacterium]
MSAAVLPPAGPASIKLELSSACQLRCPSCPTATGETARTLGAGFVRAAAFRQLLDANPGVREIEISNYGEPFLNPELGQILADADARGVVLRCDNGSNLNNARDDVLEALVRHRLRTLRCSIDGASAETYAVYRVGGDFARVLANIRTINAHKRRYASPFPELTWQFIAFGHNQHEIEAARAQATALDMKFFVKLNWDERFSPPIDEAMLKRAGRLEDASRTAHRARTGADYMDPLCHQLWDSPQINWDGRVLGCCRNFWGEFGGNAFRDGLSTVLDGERMRHARAMLQGRAPARADVPCSTCEIYLDRRRHGRWVERDEAGVDTSAR